MECKHQYDLDSSKKGHFRVVSSFCFKARLRAKPLIRILFFRLVQIKLIFKRKSRKVLHLASFWKWGFLNSEMVYWGWRDAWYDQTTFTVFKFCPEFLTCILAAHADVLLARHAILPRGRLSRNAWRIPMNVWLPATRRSFLLFGEKWQAKEEKRNAWYEYDTFTFQVTYRPWVLKINQS